MPFELDTKVSLRRARTITLGEQEFKVPPLSLRQIILAADMLPKITAAETAHDSIGLLVDFVALGLVRAYPTITRDDLLDLDSSIGELRVAADVVAEQAGAKRETEPGEAVATSDLIPPTGTSSSPISA